MPAAVVPWSPAAIPATCVAWNECAGSNGSVRVLPRRRGRRERPLHDHLRRRVLRQPLREAGRVLEAVRVEVRVRRVEAVVDDPDLHPVAGGLEGRRPRACRRRSAPGRPASAARGSGRSARPPRRPGRARAARPRSAAGRRRARSRRAGSASAPRAGQAVWTRVRRGACSASIRAQVVACEAESSARPNVESGGALQRHDDLGHRVGPRPPRPSPESATAANAAVNDQNEQPSSECG